VKKLYIFLVLFLFPCVGFARLDKNFEKNFPDIIIKYCQSTIDYTLDRKFETVKEEFHETINCTINDAISTQGNNIAQKVKNHVANAWPITALEIPEKFTSQSCSAKEMQDKSKKMKSIPSSCGDIERRETIEEDYSACRIGEQILREWCGYQKFLWAKSNHDESTGEWIRKLTTDQKKYLSMEKADNSALGYLQLKEKYQELLDTEYKKTQQAIVDTIFFYQKYEQNYRLHAWFIAVREGLKKTNQLLTSFRETMNIYPLKFINATTSAP